MWGSWIKTTGFSEEPIDIKAYDLDKVGDPCIAWAVVCSSEEHSSAEGNLHECTLGIGAWGVVSYEIPCYPDTGAQGGSAVISTSGNTPNDSGAINTTNGNYSSTSSGSNPNYNTSPKPCTRCNFNSENDDPCEKLKIKYNQPSFKNAFNNLNTSANYALTHESGFDEVYNANGTSNFMPTPMGENNNVIPRDDATSAMHIHQDNSTNEDEHTAKIFSPKDIKALLTTFVTNANAAGLNYQDTYCMMLSSQGTYAIKITDPNYDVSTVNWGDLKDLYIKDASGLVDENGNLSQSNLQKIFFETLKRANLQDKVALYKATNVTPNSNTVPQWAKVNPATLALEPCSN